MCIWLLQNGCEIVDARQGNVRRYDATLTTYCFNCFSFGRPVKIGSPEEEFTCDEDEQLMRLQAERPSQLRFSVFEKDIKGSKL
jgi:hypothetical protein